MKGVGTAEDIDAGMKLGTNQPMGPLQLADFIGSGSMYWQRLSDQKVLIEQMGVVNMFLHVCHTKLGIFIVPFCVHNPAAKPFCG